jgi:hypothetical protein
VAKARIEFSYKRKKNDKLEDNEINNRNEEVDLDDDGLNFSDDSEEYIRKKTDKSSKNYAKKENQTTISVDRKNSYDKSTNKSEDDNNFNGGRKKNMCFICKLPGHFAKECVLTKESCYECGEKGHIAKECQGGVREAKLLTENRVKAILSQQSAFKFITPGAKISNVINYLMTK